MTPFIKRNLLIPISTILFLGFLFTLIRIVPALRGRVEHLEFIVISIMIMISLVIMLFWTVLGTLGGLTVFLISMMFLYRPLTALNPYYYAVLIVAFFLNSFVGYYIHKKISISDQDYRVASQKIQEDRNLIENHKQHREAEISAMGRKIEGLLDLKDIADSLSLVLSEEECLKTVAEKSFELFKGDSRVLLYMVGGEEMELNLAHAVKADSRKPVSLKKGGIFDRWVMKNMKSLLIKDARKDFRFSADVEEARDDFTSLISKPLISEGNVLGVLRVDSPGEAIFAQHELRMLDIIGELATVAIENARLYKQTEELATRDSLTRLYVHRHFMSRLDDEIRRALRNNMPFALIMLDVDDFKDFNDKYGHVAGDEVLKSIGCILRSRASAGDLLGRYGGEEFVFVALGCDKAGALKLAGDILEDIRRTPVSMRRESCFVTASIGVAMFPHGGTSKEDIIREADRCLYEAKSKGKDRICVK